MPKYNQRANVLTATYQFKSVNGRDYLIVPAVPVREQVMNTYYVPAEELSFAEMWNGTPITIRHPKLNSGSANVPEPDVAVIGKFFNATWDETQNRLLGEYWIDIGEAMQWTEGQYILNSIYSGNVLETSTGYWAAEEYTQGEFGGRKYQTIQHNLKPDHIAILVDEIGACSVEDGCGVNRNSLFHQLYANAGVFTQGGPGSGDYGHGGREGQVGGSAPGSHVRRRGQTGRKILPKDTNAYFVLRREQADKVKKDGIRTRTSLMSAARAEAMYQKFKDAETEAAILEIKLKKGTPYESITASTITVSNVPSNVIKEIDPETLKSKPASFKNKIDCGCEEKANLFDNQQSLMQRIETIRKAFYSEFMDDSPQNLYFRDIFDNYCIVEKGDQLWKVSYTTTGEDIKFSAMDTWEKVSLEYVNTNADDMPMSCYLVVEDKDGKKVGRLPVKDADGTPNHRLMGAAWAALHGGYRGNKYEGPGKQEAIRKLKALYKKEGMDLPSTNASITITGTNPTIILKGEAIGSTTKNSATNWIVTLRKLFEDKEKPMKVKMKAALEALRGTGITVNAENIDEEMELEMAGDEDEDEDEEEGDETEERTPNKNTKKGTTTKLTKLKAIPQLSANEVEALRGLAKLDVSGLQTLAAGMPAVLEMVKNTNAEKEAQKKTLVSMLVGNSANPLSEDELNALPLPALIKLNAQYTVNYAGMAGTTFESGSDEEVLPVPVVLNAAAE